MRFDSVADSLGLQAAYMAEDFPQAQTYLDRLVKVGNHGNSSVNFGFCLLAKQGKWPELATLLSEIVKIQQQGEKEGGRKFVVSRTTLETFANLTSATIATAGGGGREGGRVAQPEPAVLSQIIETLNKMKDLENGAAMPSVAGTVAAAAAAAVVAERRDEDRIGGGEGGRPGGAGS